MKDHEQEQQGGDRLWKWEVGCLEGGKQGNKTFIKTFNKTGNCKT